MLTFPRRPVVRMFFDRWRDISGDVRQSPAISITHGRKDWAAKPSPAQCRFTLDDGPDNGNGDYDPNNPLGQWFDYLSLNTPVEVGLHYGEDVFDRVVGAGWSTSPDMGSWLSFQSAGTVASDVTGSAGRHLITSTSAFIANYLPDVAAKDVDVVDEWTLGAIDVTVGNIEPANLLLRGQTTAEYYMLRTEITTTEQITLRIMLGSGTTFAGPVTVMAYPGAASTVTTRFQADGNTLRGKVWRTDQGEPLDWHIEYSLTPGVDTIYGPGWVGVRSGLAVGNTNTKPVTIRNNTFTVTVPRFAGETSKIVPKSTVDHKNWWSEVECAAVRRRLNKGEKPLDTALRRYITRGESPVSLADYWPLDDEATAATRTSNLLAGLPVKFLRGPSSGLGAINYGVDTKLLATPKGAELTTDARLRFDVTPGDFNTTDGYSFTWLQRVGPGSVGWVILDTSTHQIFIDFNAGVFTIRRSSKSIVEIITLMTVNLDTSIAQEGTDNEWHMIGYGHRVSGGTVTYDFAIDDYLVQTSATSTMGLPNWIAVLADAEPNSTMGIAHVVALQRSLFNATGLPGFPYSILREIYLGRAHEHAGTRFNRLCLEEGITTAFVGDPVDTPAMGPQRPLPVMSLLGECIEVDQGSGIDPRGAAGLGMRTHRATVAQDPAVTLQYIGQVAHELAAATDDQGILNDVTAKRPEGAEYRVQQLTGPKNVADPGTNPQAAGRVDTSVNVNVQADVNLPDQATWRVHMGTTDAPRYPTVTVDLAAEDIDGDHDLLAAILGIGLDDRIDITGAAVRRIFNDIRLCVRGYTETIDTAYQHRIMFNCSPFEPLNVGVYGDAGSRRDTAETSLQGALTSSATSFTVNVTKGQPWTTAAGQFPMDINIRGEQVRISAIAAPSSSTPPLTQVFTVAAGGRAVNGVPKDHPAGAAVTVFDPVYHGH